MGLEIQFRSVKCTVLIRIRKNFEELFISIRMVVHLTFHPHIFFVQVKSGACYITGQWGLVQNKMK